MKLHMLSTEPILSPKIDNPWEAGAVFNCAAIYDNGLIHMIYRATDSSSNDLESKFVNSLGYAVSRDGISFNRLEKPILTNDVEQELRGPEDPRIVQINDTFYMMYTGYGGRFDGDYRICLATSKNLIDWQRHGVVLNEPNKDASLFPELIDGKYFLLHRRPPNIWLACSDDLKMWHNHVPIMGPISVSSLESEKIGIAGPPVRTPEGWFLIYHGVGQDNRYCLGAALLDLEDPGIVLARQADPILTPMLNWEIDGYVPNVVFSCGQVIIGEELFVYYGGADTAIGVASMKVSDIQF